jgi:hypothetical protein
MAAGLIVASGMACATMSVSSHVERGLDFTSYRSFEWGPRDALPAGDPRLERNSFFEDRLQGAVEKELAARGLTRATADTADLLVHYHGSVSQRMEVDWIDRGQGYYRTGDDRPANVVTYEAGTLILDVVDARTKRVIWRVWAQDSLFRFLSSDDRMAAEIDEAVQRMFARFPRPGPSGG